MIKILLALALISTSALAHVSGHGDPETRTSVSCYSQAARAAWGAASQNAGAPEVFVYVRNEIMEPIFFGRIPMPKDGIYVSEALDQSLRAAYEEQAKYGWRDAMKRGKTNTMEAFMAIYLDHFCKL